MKHYFQYSIQLTFKQLKIFHFPTICKVENPKIITNIRQYTAQVRAHNFGTASYRR